MAAGWRPLHDTRGGLTELVETLAHSKNNKRDPT
jgi:hypothetical protein